MTSRLSSSAHWRSSNASSVGRSIARDDQVDDLVDEHLARAEAVGAAGRAGAPTRSCAERPERRDSADRAGQVEDGRERDLPVVRRQGALRDPEPGGLRRDAAIDSRSRVLPTPASPGEEQQVAAALRRPRRSAARRASSRSSRPTRSGLWTGRTEAHRRASVRPRVRASSVIRPMCPPAAVRRPRRAIVRRTPGGAMLTLDTIREAPKALLHDHLDGGLRPATVIDLAREYGYDDLPTEDVDGARGVVPARRGPQEPRAVPRDVPAHVRRHAGARRDRPGRRGVRRGPRGRRRRLRRGPLRARAVGRAGPDARRGRARRTSRGSGSGRSARPRPASRS